MVTTTHTLLAMGTVLAATVSAIFGFMPELSRQLPWPHRYVFRFLAIFELGAVVWIVSELVALTN